MANKLQNESSLYLKQHQHNPVNWFPWTEEALQKAQKENKLIIVSIGYSSCHWCHVMERQSFEDETVAKIMNDHFISIKVDREERPDIDQVYMTAVQLMTNAGGWPLNCICLPDGRPIYGGTYFTPENWKNILSQIQNMWTDSPQTAYEYAEKLTTAIQQSERLPIAETPDTFQEKDLDKIVGSWTELFDKTEGGYDRAPKFPLPNNWKFLLRYGVLSQDMGIVNHVHFTLEKIANGGIFDHVNGGFARYSVDHLWHVPHFEKMLYDNAQLMSIYSEAYQHTPSPLYKRTVEKIFDWLQREMSDNDGGFYSAIDADSEGIEGKYYTLSQSEIETLFGDESEFVYRLYHITRNGNWAAENTNVLFRTTATDKDLINKYQLTLEQFHSKVSQINNTLLHYRGEKKAYPHVDKKKITSWNALMLKGLLKAFEVFGDSRYYEAALRNVDFISNNLITDENTLLHQYPDSQRQISGFLDDYATCIDAFIKLYQINFDEKWLKSAEKLCKKAIELFYNEDKQEFVYSTYDELIAQKVDIMDNVIPSSSSMIIRQIHKLSILFENNSYSKLVDQVLGNILPHMHTYGPAYSNWAITLLEKVYGCNEIAITGEEAQEFRNEFSKHYIANKIFLGGTGSSLPLMKDKEIKKSKVYICKNKTCSLPQDSVQNAILLINKNGSN